MRADRMAWTFAGACLTLAGAVIVIVTGDVIRDEQRQRLAEPNGERRSGWAS